jgi:hypothetical protein
MTTHNLNISSLDKDEILANHRSFMTSLNIPSGKESEDLPYLYWMSKLHKTPCNERYIAGSSTFSTKELSIHLTKILSAAKEGQQKYCETVIKINRLAEGHNSYPFESRRPAETVSLQRRQICYRWGTSAYWSLVPRSSMFYLYEFCLKNMWNCSLTQQILSHNFYDWKLYELLLLSGFLICHAVGWYIELKNQKFWWRIPVSAGRRHTSGYDLCPSTSRFIFKLICVGVSSKACKR